MSLFITSSTCLLLILARLIQTNWWFNDNWGIRDKVNFINQWFTSELDDPHILFFEGGLDKLQDMDILFEATLEENKRNDKKPTHEEGSIESKDEDDD